MQKSSEKLVSVLVKAIPYACLAVSVVILGFLLLIGNYVLAVKGLYIIVPVITVSAAAVIRPGLFERDAAGFFPRIRLGHSPFQYLVLIFIL